MATIRNGGIPVNLFFNQRTEFQFVANLGTLQVSELILSEEVILDLLKLLAIAFASGQSQAKKPNLSRIISDTVFHFQSRFIF